MKKYNENFNKYEKRPINNDSNIGNIVAILIILFLLATVVTHTFTNLSKTE